MRHTGMLVLGLALALATSFGVAGCENNKVRKYRKGATCADAIENSLRLPLTARGQNPDTMTGVQRERLVLVSMAMVERCTNDRWATEAIECFAGAETLDNIGACKGTMTREQERKSEEAVEQVSSGTWSPEGDPSGLTE